MGGHRKKLLSTSQPHLAVLSDHHLVDTSSVDAADDIIFERTRNNPRKFSGSNNNTRPTVIPPPLQFKKHSSSSTNLQHVVTGLTGLPVTGAPQGAQLQLGPPGGLLTVDRLAQSQLHQQKNGSSHSDFGCRHNNTRGRFADLRFNLVNSIKYIIVN